MECGENEPGRSRDLRLFGRGFTIRAGVDSRSLATNGQLIVPFVSFRLSLFLWSKPGFLPLFSLAFVLFSLIAHVCFSLLEDYLHPDPSQGLVCFASAPPNVSVLVSSAQPDSFTAAGR
jgi:hypothetical protein